MRTPIPTPSLKRPLTKEDLAKYIFRSYLIIIAGLGAVTLGLLIAVYYSTSITPALLKRNYSSISYAAQMKDSYFAILNGSGKNNKNDSVVFSESFRSAEQNITEPGEKEILKHIGANWSGCQKDLAACAALPADDMTRTINQLVEVNEKGMFALAQRGYQLRLTVLVSFVMLGFLAVTYSLLFANDCSSRLFEILNETK